MDLIQCYNLSKYNEAKYLWLVPNNNLLGKINVQFYEDYPSKTESIFYVHTRVNVILNMVMSVIKYY